MTALCALPGDNAAVPLALLLSLSQTARFSASPGHQAGFFALSSGLFGHQIRIDRPQPLRSPGSFSVRTSSDGLNRHSNPTIGQLRHCLSLDTSAAKIWPLRQQIAKPVGQPLRPHAVTALRSRSKSSGTAVGHLIRCCWQNSRKIILERLPALL